MDIVCSVIFGRNHDSVRVTDAHQEDERWSQKNWSDQISERRQERNGRVVRIDAHLPQPMDKVVRNLQKNRHLQERDGHVGNHEDRSDVKPWVDKFCYQDENDLWGAD